MDDALATLNGQERQPVPATLIRLLGGLEAAMDSRPPNYHMAGASQQARSSVSPLEILMRIMSLALALVPVMAMAQASFPTDFPEGSVPVQAEALKQFLTGKTFVAKPVVGSELRIQYKDSFAFLNSGGTSDSGRWRTEGSSVCNEWKTIRASCSEMRLLGQALYVKRSSNGEVMRLLEQ